MKQKILKLFLETPVFNDGNKEISKIKKDDGGYNVIHSRYEYAKENGKAEVYNHNGFTFELYDFQSHQLKKRMVRMFALKKDEICGFMTLDPDTSKPFPSVVICSVFNKFQGYGIAGFMYDTLIRKYGGIMSDSSLTGKKGFGSFQVWEKLGKKYIPYVYEDGRLEKVEGFDKRMMKNSASRFVVSIKPLS